jgi:hypothetical protein
MCKCTPEIRTPFCGRGDCLPPGYANLGEWLGSSSAAAAEPAAQASLDRVWAQAIRQSQLATSEQPTKLTAQEAQQLFAELAALRTQLEQAQERLDGWKREFEKVQAKRDAYRERAEQAEARETALRDALVRAKDALNWRDNKIRLRHRDPLGEAEIRALGERVGYGVLMSTASRLWYEKAGGGAFAVGDCLSTVEAADEAAARALSGEGSNQ